MKLFMIQSYKTRIVLFIFFLWVFSVNSSYADHLVGSDITYQCISTPGVSTISLKIYRDFAGAHMCKGCNNAQGRASGCTTANAWWGYTNSNIRSEERSVGKE